MRYPADWRQGRHAQTLCFGKILAVLIALLVLWVHADSASAQESSIRGIVLAVDGNTAKVATIATTPATVGATARIFVVIPDIGAEAHVATARVVRVEGTTAHLQIEQATGTVEVGQQVAIAAAAAPAPAMPVGAATIVPESPPPAMPFPPATIVPASPAPAMPVQPAVVVTVPSVIGQPAAAAKASLAAQGLTAVFRGGEPAPSSDLAYTIYQQQPAAGAQAPANRQVAVVMYGAVSSAATTIPLPTARAPAASQGSGEPGLRLASSLDGATEADRVTVQDLVARLERHHISGRTLDTQIAERWFDGFLKGIDGFKLYFTESDVAAFRPIVPKLDELARAGDLRFAYGLYEIYLRRVDERLQLAEELLSSSLDFTVDEVYIDDLKETVYARSERDSRDLWRQRIKYDLLRLEADGYSPEEARSEMLERIARLRTLKYRMNDSTLIEIYLNALATAFDSESRYWAAPAASTFGTSEAIAGAVGIETQWIDTSFEVTRIAEGMPAARQGQLQLGDRIIGLGGATGPIDDVRELYHTQFLLRLRGRVGTEVRLQFVPKAGGEPQIVQYTREQMRPTPVTGEVLQALQASDERKYSVGFIDLHNLYAETAPADAAGFKPRSSAQDIRTLLDEFRAKQVDAVIVDMRRCRGGTLEEIANTAALLLPPGPVAQSKFRGGQLTPLAAAKPVLSAEQVTRYASGLDAAGAGQGWNGPLVVLVSRNTLGSGEILAAAIQDYGRGLVVGDAATFGMGIANHSYQLAAQGGAPGSWGMLRVTSGYLYRPNGESTQLRGMAADLNLPSLFSGDRIGAAFRDAPLPTESTSRAEYERLDYLIDQALRDQLLAASLQRRKSSPEFQQLERRIAEYSQARARHDAPLRRDEFLAWRAGWKNAEDEPEFEPLGEAYRQEAVLIALDYASRVELSRAQRSYAERRYDQAWQQFAAAVRIDPAHAAAWHHSAWSLATCPDAAKRDAPRAVEHATRACELTEFKHWPYLLTLAVAHAQAGQFDDAATRLDEALALAPADKQTAYAYLRDRFKNKQGYAAR